MPDLSFILLSTGGWEWVALAAALLTLGGVWLRWRSQWHFSDVEEDLKDGKISEAQARWRTRWVEWRAVALTFGGLGLLALAMAMLLS